MKKALSPVLLVALSLTLNCGREGDELRRDQQQYDVVLEGEGGPVTSTIHAPGETTPPLMPALTESNADTTTASTLETATDTSQSSFPGAVAGTSGTGQPSSPSQVTTPATSTMEEGKEPEEEQPEPAEHEPPPPLEG